MKRYLDEFIEPAFILSCTRCRYVGTALTTSEDIALRHFRTKGWLMIGNSITCPDCFLELIAGEFCLVDERPAHRP